MRIEIENQEENHSECNNYICMIDLSGSMYDQIDELKKVILHINEIVNENDTITIGWFSGYNEYGWLCKVSHKKNINLEKLIESEFYVRGLTCYTNIIEYLINTLNYIQTGSNALFFLTDGYPNDHFHENHFLELCSSVSNKIQFSMICGFGRYYERNLLNKIADKLQGHVCHSEYMKDVLQHYTHFLHQNGYVSYPLSEVYDHVWCIDTHKNEIYICSSSNIQIPKSNKLILYAMNINDVITIEDPMMLYSLCYVLMKKNQYAKVIQILKQLSLFQDANKVRKALTTSQKGQVENSFKDRSFSNEPIIPQENKSLITLNEFLSHIEENPGTFTIDLKQSQYRKITKKKQYENKSNVIFSDHAIITGIIGNEKRANVSFQTKIPCVIEKVFDSTLLERIDLYNQKNIDHPIVFPMESYSIRNYTFIANGDFNFDVLHMNGQRIIPYEDIDILSEEEIQCNIKTFSSHYKKLLHSKIHQSVISFYMKKHDLKHKSDKRFDTYGQEGADILTDLGFDDQLRYSPKPQKNDRILVDYIPFQSFHVTLKGASAISASKSYEKYGKRNNKQKLNPCDEICYPLFDLYDVKCISFTKNEIIDFMKEEKKKIGKEISKYRNEITKMTFYMMVNQIWFDDIKKSDKFEYDNMVFQIKEEKEYI